MTITDRILKIVAAEPGLTAWGIAKKMKWPSGTVSATLYRLAKTGRIVRKTEVDVRFHERVVRDPWKYYPGQK
jgi:DNA-binding MarR family transcriptional regulator